MKKQNRLETKKQMAQAYYKYAKEKDGVKKIIKEWINIAKATGTIYISGEEFYELINEVVNGTSELEYVLDTIVGCDIEDDYNYKLTKKDIPYECSNCGNIYSYKQIKIYKDELGEYYMCPNCDVVNDVDVALLIASMNNETYDSIKDKIHNTSDKLGKYKYDIRCKTEGIFKDDVKYESFADYQIVLYKLTISLEYLEQILDKSDKRKVKEIIITNVNNINKELIRFNADNKLNKLDIDEYNDYRKNAINNFVKICDKINCRYL